MIAALTVATAANPGFGSRAALPEIRTTDPFEAFSASQALYRQAARAMELECQAILPLRIGHLEQINLWHCSGNVEQGVDSAKTIEGALDDDFRRLGLTQVERVDQWFGACGAYSGCDLLQLILISRGKYNSGEIAC